MHAGKLCVRAETWMALADTCAGLQGQAQACFISAQAAIAACFRCLSSLPVSLTRQLSRSQLNQLHHLTSKTARVSTRTDSHRAVELTVLTATGRGRGTVTETGLQMVTASGITAVLICQIMTVSKSVSTDTNTNTPAKMTEDTRTARGGIENESMLRGMTGLETEEEARQRER